MGCAWSAETALSPSRACQKQRRLAPWPKKNVPVSPWSKENALKLRPSADLSEYPRMLRRSEYDNIIAGRLEHKRGGQHLAQVMKVASTWRGRPLEHGHTSKLSRTPPSRPPLKKPVEIDPNNLPSREHVQEGKSLLDQRCAFLGLKQVEMVGDGNCQFRSLAQELYGSQEHYKLVRSAVIEHMRKHSADFSFLFEGDEWQHYLSNMSRSREWGDELTLRAAVDAFNIKLHVLTSTSENWYLVYEPASNSPERQAFITYISPIHYNMMEPIS